MRRSLNILVQFVWRGGGVPVGIFKCDSRKEKYLGSVFSGWNKCLCIRLYLLSCISDAFSLMFTADFFWFIKCLYIYTVPLPSVTNIYHTIIFYKLTLWHSEIANTMYCMVQYPFRSINIAWFICTFVCTCICFTLNSLLTCTSVIYIWTEDGNPSSIQTQENPDHQKLENMSEDEMIPRVSMRQWYM
jgi:hypothetical protein